MVVMHPVLARHVAAETVRQRRVRERRSELRGDGTFAPATVRPVRGRDTSDHASVAERRNQLIRSRFDVPDEPLRRHFSLASGSALHDERAAQVGEALLGSMMRNAQRARARMPDPMARALFNATAPHGPGRHELALRPRRPLPDRQEGAESARLRVDLHRGVTHHYDQNTNRISLMDTRIDHAAHELQHASDHLRGRLDLHQPSHRLVAERRAFQQQTNAHIQAAGRREYPPEFEGRSPEQMAKSYEGKKGYPGTLEESADIVARWNARRQ